MDAPSRLSEALSGALISEEPAKERRSRGKRALPLNQAVPLESSSASKRLRRT